MNKSNIEHIDPSFMEGVDAEIYKNKENPYKQGSFEKCLFDMGRNWVKDNEVTADNLLTKMLEVKDWNNL